MSDDITTRRHQVLALLLAAGLAACDSQPPVPAATQEAAGRGPEGPAGIALNDARVQLPIVAGRPGVAYLTITLSGGPPRRIVAVHAAAAGRANMHANREEQGVVRMVSLKEVALEPGRSFRFFPGGDHIMLFDLDPQLKAGDTTELTLTFDNGDKATIAAPVVVAGAEREAMP